MVAVYGIVTLDGSPVSSGRIEFFPENGRPASGEIASDGSYELTTFESGDGAKPGSYKVTVTSQSVPDDGPVYKSYEEEMLGISSETSRTRSSKSVPVKWLVPQRYANRASSDLTAEVGSGEQIDFQLHSKPKRL